SGRHNPGRGHRRVRAVRRGGLRRRNLGPSGRRRQARRRPPGAHRRVHHPGLGSQPVWLVFILVLTWTSFPTAFAAIMTALFVPLSLSLLGIVLRGAGFAFRHTAERLNIQRLTGATFAAASLITPFFMGTVVGAVVTGQVPVRPVGNVLAAWTSPTAILTGFLFVAACAYISAVFLVLEAGQRGHQDLVRYFSLRATAAGVVTGALAGGTFAELSTSVPYVYHRLTGIALWLVAISIAAGI